MATGNSLVTFLAQNNTPPSASAAAFNVRNAHLVLDFDAAADESAVFQGVLPRQYAGGGLTITIIWAAASATSGACVWNAAIERIDASSLDIDADSFAAAQAATGTAPGTSGQVLYTAITMTSGAQMDSLAAGEAFRLKITRDADNGSDTMTGDAELWAVEIKET